MIEERLRCPDCFGTGLRTADGSAGMQIVCERCGGEMKLRGHVLHALPKAMAPSDADNRSYYDMLSDDEESLLARRARTRNHQAKLDCVLRELELDGDTRGKRVLELGVGYGSHGAAIVQCGHEILRPGHLSAMKITERNLRRWTDAAGARDVRIGPNVFTPNGPAPLIPAYDWADRFLKSHRRLHALSVQICVSGER